MKFKDITYSIPWNLLLITVGSIIFSFGLKAIVIPNGMITGGFSGAGILLFYYTKVFTPGIWYMLLNIPIFILGWLFISKRFLFYSLYGAVVITVFIDIISFEMSFNDLMLAVIAGGAVVGAGAGIVFRSLGSLGGNDIISIILNQKYSIRIGTYNFCFNLVLFLFSFGTLDTELILYSITMSYIASQVIEYCMAMFSQRKTILIISNEPKEIARQIQNSIKGGGATFLKGEGSYTGQKKDIILTVVNTFQIKRIEEIVFTIDPDAFLIAENTFNVLGKSFSQRKVY